MVSVCPEPAQGNFPMKRLNIYTLLIICTVAWYPAPASGQKNGEQKLYTVAMGAYKDGFYDVAIGQLKKFLTKYPKSSHINPARLMLAEAFYQKKDYNNAIPHYKILIKQTKSDQLNYRLGTCYYQTNRFLNAATAFSDIGYNEKTEKIFAETLYLQAESLLRVKEFGSAAKIYQKFIDKSPKHPYYKNALFGLGWSQFQGKDFSAATGSLKTFISEYPPIPQRARAQFLIGFSLEKLAILPQAITAYDKLLKNYPKDKHAKEARLRLGLVCFESRFYDRAAAHLERYVKANPKNSGPYLYRIALSHLRLKRYDRADKFFTKLIKDSQSSFDKEARYYLGSNCFRQNKKKCALAFFQEVVRKYPKTEIAKTCSLQIGIIQAERKKYKAAKTAFNHAIASDDKAQAAEAQYRLAEIIQKGQKPNHALVYFRDVIKNFPQQKDWVELAQLKVAEGLAAQGKYDDAKKNLLRISKYRKTADNLLKEIILKKNTK